MINIKLNNLGTVNKNRVMKYFFISAEIGEGYPDYDFVVKAKTIKKAIKIAINELKASYPDLFFGRYVDNFSVHEITPESLLERMTIN